MTVNRRIAAALVGLSIVIGGGLGYAIQQSSSSASASPSPSSTTPTPDGPSADDTTEAPDPDDVTIRPGAIGAVEGGQPVEQYVTSGVLVRNQRENVCDGPELSWASDQARGIDVLTNQSDTIVSMGVRSPALATTSEGIRVGFTYAEVKAAYPTASEPEAAGYGQTGVFVREGDAWLGFLFDEAPDVLDDSSDVSFMEVTRGSQPSLMRDGC